MTTPNFIHEDYITDLKICDKLIKWFHSNKKFHGPGKLGDADGKIIVDIKKKQSTDFSFDLAKGVQKVQVISDYVIELQTMLGRYLQLYAFANHVDPFKVIEPVNIQYYKPNEGYRAFHSERGMYRVKDRFLVFQTYLNTVEDGGETEFFYQQYKCKAVKGKTLIWPVEWTHTHRGIVSPTEDKYILTGWYSFDKI